MAAWKLPEFRIHEFVSAQEVGETLPWQVTDYGIPDAWTRSRGEGVRVGIVDTGIDGVHLAEGDLTDCISGLRDFSGSRFGAADRVGHGTHVAGIILARQGNHKGTAGIAPAATGYVAKALGDNGSGSDRAIANSLEACVLNGCDIINLSLGAPNLSEMIADAIRQTVASGKIVVAAAGNNGGRVNYPAALPECLAVSATDQAGNLASFSSRGPEIDVGAPGVEILSCYLSGEYALLSGTSMAAPWITGILALKLAYDRQNGVETDTSINAVRTYLGRVSSDMGEPGTDDLFGVGIPVGDKLFHDHSIPAPATPFLDFAGLQVFVPARSGDAFSVAVK